MRLQAWVPNSFATHMQSQQLPRYRFVGSIPGCISFAMKSLPITVLLGDRRSTVSEKLEFFARQNCRR